MSTWLLLAVVSVAGAGASQEVSSAAGADFKLRSYHQYEDAIDDALRTEARTKDEHERADAIRRLGGPVPRTAA